MRLAAIALIASCATALPQFISTSPTSDPQLTTTLHHTPSVASSPAFVAFSDQHGAIRIGRAAAPTLSSSATASIAGLIEVRVVGANFGKQPLQLHGAVVDGTAVGSAAWVSESVVDLVLHDARLVGLSDEAIEAGVELVTNVGTGPRGVLTDYGVSAETSGWGVATAVDESGGQQPLTSPPFRDHPPCPPTTTSPTLPG